MRKVPALAVIALMALSVTTSVRASLIVDIYSDESDGAAYGTGNFSSQDLIVGGATGGNYAGIAIFELPERNSGTIISADLTFTVRHGGTMPTANADIYGLGYLTGAPAMQSSWLLIADTETRDGDTLGTNIGTDLPVKLVDNAVTAGTTMNTNDTTVASGAGILGFVNDLYDVYGATAGDWAVFRVNPDADQFISEGAASNFRYGGSHQGVRATQLSLTIVIPEPSTAFLLCGLVASAFFVRRRRKMA